MNKGRFFVFIIWGGILLLFIYSIMSGSLKTSIKADEENTKLFYNILKTLKTVNAKYQVLSGRVGGTFVFKITLNEVQQELDMLTNILEESNLKRVHSDTNSLIFCIEKRVVRIVNLEEKKFILEYERDFTGCKN